MKLVEHANYRSVFFAPLRELSSPFSVYIAALMPCPNSACVILVPAFGAPAAKCEEGLRELEKCGYPIRRVRGFSAIDQGRNQMASDALNDGVAETMWIDTDIGFTADDVERLRSHNLPIVRASSGLKW